jgi:esterase/lipase superfamily enzyme
MALHASYVWYTFIAQNPHIKNLFMIAHSAGGWCTTSIMEKYGADSDQLHNFFKQVKKLAMTDSCNFSEESFGEHK